MCGIIGSIGLSNDPAVSHKLASALLTKTETRGDDAAGFWATEEGEEKSAVLFSKRPIKSSEFVNTEMWGAWKNRPIDLMIGHCRKSTCRGSENVNINNHPFVSTDYRTALVHNGNVPEFDSLRSNYEVMSDCDSEILLRMMERGSLYNDDYVKKEFSKLKLDKKRLIKDLKEDEPIPTWVHRLSGLRDIFARINYGAMAVACAERWPDGTRALWLFRDRDRPLNVVDMRSTLGQVYIVSEKKIWREAVEACPEACKYCKKSTPIIEFPAMCIWLLTYKDKEFDIRKWKINRTRQADTTLDQERPEPKKILDYGIPPDVIMDLTFKEHKVLPNLQEKKPPIPDSNVIEVDDEMIESHDEFDEVVINPLKPEIVEASPQKKTEQNSTVGSMIGTITESSTDPLEQWNNPLEREKSTTTTSLEVVPLWNKPKLTLGKNGSNFNLEGHLKAIGQKGEPPNQFLYTEEEEEDYKTLDIVSKERPVEIPAGVKDKLMIATSSKKNKPTSHRTADHLEFDEFNSAKSKLIQLLNSVESNFQELAQNYSVTAGEVSTVTDDIKDFTRQLEISISAIDHIYANG